LQSASKRTKTDEGEPEPKLNVTVQMGLYAAEMFAANIVVKHIINLVVVGVLFRLLSAMTICLEDVAWVWCYDRQGIIQYSGINFIQDLPRFMVLLYALQRFSLADWSRNADFKEDEKSISHNIIIGDVYLELHTSHKDRVTHYGLK
jgi:hypothetical protein